MLARESLGVGVGEGQKSNGIAKSCWQLARAPLYDEARLNAKTQQATEMP